jgi:hypothetical protein
MKQKKKKNSLFNAAKNLQRRLALQQGFYDGRFAEKTIKDRKKEESRRKARRKISSKELEE